MGQDVLALRTPVLRRFTNGTPETVILPEGFQRPQKYGAQRLSGPAHVVNKRLFPLTTGNDVVSRNITMVLENLLKDYESSQLPTHGKGNIQNVFLSSNISVHFIF
jgi:gamma-aminobutyric acid receptor subunit alpha